MKITVVQVAFVATVAVSIAGNVAHGVETQDPVAIAIGAWIPISLLLADLVREHTQAGKHVQYALWAVGALVMAYSAAHLAPLAQGDAGMKEPQWWLGWIFPISVDVLMIISFISARASQPHPEAISEPSQDGSGMPSRDAIPEPSRDASQDEPRVIPKPVPRRARKSSPKTPVRASRDEEQDVVMLRAAAATDGVERIGIAKAKAILKCGDAHAKKMLPLAFPPVEAPALD